MAVGSGTQQRDQSGANAGRQTAVPASAGRRLKVGTNVLAATILVVGIVTVVQVLAYQSSRRWDMTLSGVNSLSEGTKNLVRNLESDVRLTSLYFETDRETEDQPRYRRAVADLLDLYAAGNRGRVTAQWINPLKDHEKYKSLLSDLRDNAAFQEQIAKYQERIDAYLAEGDGLDARMKALVAGELERIRELGGAAMGEDATQLAVAPVEMLLQRWSDELADTRQAVESLALPSDPQYSDAVTTLKNLYRSFGDTLKRIADHGTAEVARRPALSPAAVEYLTNAGTRFQEVSDAVEKENQVLQDLDRLRLDDLVVELGPTNNAILVETDKDATVVDFASVWPPVDPNMSSVTADFFKRAFKGEERVTSAILRATHKEQTAVVFVRYGGQPLLMPSFMPGQPRSPYQMMKEQLETANFVVHEWDLKTADTPPEMDPAPTRSIYVVLKPTPPQRGPMGQPSEDPPFTDSHKKKLLDALGENGRALFIAGWSPGPFGPIPDTYEYGDYLKEQWGITVQNERLLVQFGSVAPGRFVPMGRNFFILGDVETGDHDIVSGPQMPFAMPWCAPLTLADPPPEGVTLSPLIIHPKQEGVWGISNITTYENQLSERNYLTLAEGDLEGPFTLAAAASKGDSKLVVVSARGFAEDSIAFARGIVQVAGGFQIRSLNPGNITLLVNSLHWLGDNTQFLNIGQPIDFSVLKIEKPSTIRVVQVLTIVIWPALALVGGGAVWWIRRR